MSLKKLAPAAAPLSALLLYLVLALPGLARADGPTPSAGLPPTPLTIQEAERHEQIAADMRREADRLRAEAEATRLRDDNACYDKILVNACRDKVRQAHIDRMRAIRQKEIDANQIDRIAKARKIELEAHEKLEPKPTTRPLPQASAPAATRPGPAPDASSVPAVPLKTPPGKVPADVQKRADAARAESIRRAEEDKRQRNTDAAARAEQARKDAARYDQRIKEQAAKKAAKAAQSAPAQSR